MRLAKNALIIALTVLTLVFAVSAQTLRQKDDPRHIAPTVGTGGPVGGPTGLFTIYDGQTLRRGEYTFSVAYSNFDRDPGNVDITEVPVSFQIGLSDNLELFFNTDAYKGIKVNSPTVLSSFYLPNSQLKTGSGTLQVPAAIVLAPAGATTTAFTNTAIYRPAGAPFVQYPYSGGSAGSFGIPFPFSAGGVFGFGNGNPVTLGPPSGGGAVANFPGVGSIYGSILPGVVLTTQNLTNVAGGFAGTAPVVYSTAPSYLPDAPFINRTYGQSAFSTYTAGAKWRLTDVKKATALSIVGFYRWYADKATDASGFNQLQRGASPGGNKGDFGVVLVGDSRLRNWLNISANLGYIYNSSVKGSFPNGEATILDRPDELQYGVGLDFPTNEHFQPILEFRGTRYVGGRTPNVFENNPMDGIGGVRIYPKSWYGFGVAYRYHFNQIDTGTLEDATFTQNVNTTRRTTPLIANNGAGTNNAGLGIVPGTAITSTGNLATAYPASSDPHGFIFQTWIGRRNAPGGKQIPNTPGVVNDVVLDGTTIVVPCPPGYRPKSGSCNDDKDIAVKTSASDADGDTLTYSYTVSGGRIVGQGANVNWDLSGVRPGTYTITSAVDDGCGFCGKTVTKTITVTQCDCEQIPPPCTCPSISVTGPSDLLKAGQTATFTANVSGGSQNSVTYNWSVSAGTISGGQGTPAITVDTTGLAGQSVTATVEIGGACPECPKTSSATANVIEETKPTSIKVDEFGAQKPDEIKNKLDSLYLALNNDPTAKGYIINYGTAKEKAARVKVLKAALVFRKLDPNRVEFVDGGEGEFKTELWVTPQGAAKPPNVP